MRIHKKSERRELVREKKAEKAAKISNAIQKELLSRLNDPEVDVYNGIYNFPAKEFKKVVKSQLGEEEEEDMEEELDEDRLGDMEDMEEEEEDDGNVGEKEYLVDEFVEAMSDDDVEEVGGVMRGRFGADDDDIDEEDDELDNLLRSIRKRKNSGAAAAAKAESGKKRRPRVEIEHEEEMPERQSLKE